MYYENDFGEGPAITVMWQDTTYNHTSGNGLSELMVFTDDRIPSNFPQELQNGISRIHTLKTYPKKVTLVLQRPAFDTAIIGLVRTTAHYCGLSWDIDAFKGNEDQAPWLFGVKSPEMVDFDEKTIYVPPEVSEGDGNMFDFAAFETELMGFLSVEDIGSKVVVELESDGSRGWMGAVDTPDGVLYGNVSQKGDYAFDSSYSFSEILGYVINDLG